MNLDDRLQRVAVIGAGGKMGRGIALLLLQEMARLEAEHHGTAGKEKYRLTLIDTVEASLDSLRSYLRPLIRKYAEKQINHLRSYFSNNPDLVSNEEIIDTFVDGAMDIVRLDPHLAGAYDATLIFEAIIEDIPVKTQVFSSLSANHRTGDYFLFTNTSSIPIHVLNEAGSLEGRIIGYHFYNPPAVQKLLELIPLENGNPELVKQAEELAKRLKKTVVVSKDVAGFIGNGHLLREIAFACKQAGQLVQDKADHEAISLVNFATQYYLIRPMGIFQLLDYVGIDVADYILDIMNRYLGETIEAPLVGQMLAAGIKGGQNSDGSQKAGFFQYEKGIPAAVYSLHEKRYIPLGEKGGLPEDCLPWRVLVKDPDRKEQLQKHFERLPQMPGIRARLAREYLNNSNQIARKLVDDGAANSIEDVDTVLINGFYHLYGAEKQKVAK